MMTDATLLAIVGAVQAISTGWLHYQVNRNACGGAKCVQTLKGVLGIRTERTPGEVAVSGRTGPGSPEQTQ